MSCPGGTGILSINNQRLSVPGFTSFSIQSIPGMPAQTLGASYRVNYTISFRWDNWGTKMTRTDSGSVIRTGPIYGSAIVPTPGNPSTRTFTLYAAFGTNNPTSHPYGLYTYPTWSEEPRTGIITSIQWLSGPPDTSSPPAFDLTISYQLNGARQVVYRYSNSPQVRFLGCAPSGWIPPASPARDWSPPPRDYPHKNLPRLEGAPWDPTQPPPDQPPHELKPPPSLANPWGPNQPIPLSDFSGTPSSGERPPTTPPKDDRCCCPELIGPLNTIIRRLNNV